jgi:ubiquinone/menaquinone biosynthesis C-methylase UbiE
VVRYDRDVKLKPAAEPSTDRAPEVPTARAPEALDAELYAARGIGWDGELDFYRGLVSQHARGAVLEIACGTGRVTRALVGLGADVVGLDRSPWMLAVARARDGDGGPRWVEADMRSFRLDERFGLVLIPAHSFQNLLTPDDQAATLASIHRHLLPDGLVVVHLDHPGIDWLAGLPGSGGTVSQGRTVRHPATGQPWRLAYAWTYERATQTATVRMTWERLGPSGEPVERSTLPPQPLHVVGRTEMEHALARTGFAVERLLGDFHGAPFGDESAEMIWVARRTS